jgi:hypothetical protein
MENSKNKLTFSTRKEDFEQKTEKFIAISKTINLNMDRIKINTVYTSPKKVNSKNP